MQIWPAIDLRDGKCVRLRQGDYRRETVFDDDPAVAARRWVDSGGECLHLVDLDGARDGRPVNREAIARIVETAGVPCELGGGIRDEASIGELLELGLARLIVGTRALREPDWFRQMCGQFPGKLVLGIDARDGKVATDGWLETSGVDAVEMARSLADVPIAAIVYTDIAKDGMMAGANVEAMAAMCTAVPVPVVASGGATTIEDVRRLAAVDMAGCIIGRALYEGKLDLAEAIRVVRKE